MRKLIVTRGLPGSSKSSFIKRAGLESACISPDTLRSLLSGPIMDENGIMGISQQVSPAAWSLMDSVLNSRMARGETLVVDATTTTVTTLNTYTELCRRYLYDMAVLDFSSLDYNECMRRNNAREETKIVPESSMLYMQKQMLLSSDAVSALHVINGNSPEAEKEITEFLNPKTHDFSAVSRIVHVGDIHGCSTALSTLLHNQGGVLPDDMWIFYGDITDRGPDNAGVVRIMLELLRHPNVMLLWGNHEDHLMRWFSGENSESSEFRERTLPELVREGITPQDAGTILARALDILVYTADNETVICTHAGLPLYPVKPWMLSTYQLSHGPGSYNTPVDKLWSDRALPGTPALKGVHGHRNSGGVPVISDHSVNLEGSVEFGGELRAVIHDKSGWHNVSVPNPVFVGYRDRRRKESDIIPPWFSSPSDTAMDPELKKAMEEHKGVVIKQMPDMPHVASFNFSKKVFWDKSWDDIVVRARGLFVNTVTGDIVARAYDKFFSVGEREETSPDVLAIGLNYPVTSWLKENGYLGIVGYDAQTDSLFTSSKSTSGGDFADMFREILFGQLAPGKRDELRMFLRDLEASFTFEVIDPVRDPHIIEYNTKPYVVLLDVIHRSTRLSMLPYDDLCRVAEKFGFEVKKKGPVLRDEKSFRGWYKAVSADMDRKVEGYVMEDSSGYQVKVKLPYYSFWKLCRGMKDAIVREREGGKPAHALNADFLASRGLGFTAEAAENFYKWCNVQETETLKREIIELRTMFENSPVLDETPALR